MLKWVGVPLLVVGVCVAFLTFRSPEDQTASLSEVLKQQEAKVEAAAVSPAPPLVRPRERTSIETIAAPETPIIWRQEVVVRRAAEIPPPSEPIVASPRDRLASTTPEDSSAKYELARTLQTELRRVGCYDGEIDGDWGPASKRAMTAFTDRVNAALPGNEPDYILLKLVQNHKGPACGACPTGQTLSEGRCITAALATKRASAPVSAREEPPQLPPAKIVVTPPSPTRPAATPPSDTHEATALEESTDGRMSVGAPPAPIAIPDPKARQLERARDERRAGIGVVSSYGPPQATYAAKPSKRWTQTIWDSISSRR
jgi:peptidoglycan hydrolase-like protein with peptidoglycan-binding domain